MVCFLVEVHLLLQHVYGLLQLCRVWLTLRPSRSTTCAYFNNLQTRVWRIPRPPTLIPAELCVCSAGLLEPRCLVREAPYLNSECPGPLAHPV